MALCRLLAVVTALFLMVLVGNWTLASAAEIDLTLTRYPTIHFIIFANGKYEKSNRLPALEGAPDDFKLASEMFGSLSPQENSPHKVMLHNEVSPGESTNEFKSVEELEEKLESYVKDIKPGDAVVFYYSGHGVSYGKLDYLVPTGFDPSNVNEQDVALELASTGHIAGLLGKNSPSNVIMLLDACRKDAGFDVVGNSEFPKATSSPTRDLVVLNSNAGSTNPALTIFDRVFPVGPNGVTPVTSDFTKALFAAMEQLKLSNPDLTYTGVANVTGRKLNKMNPVLDWNRSSKKSLNLAFSPTPSFWGTVSTSWNYMVKNPNMELVENFWAINPFSQYYPAVVKYFQDSANEKRRLPQTVEVSVGDSQIAGTFKDTGYTYFNPISVDVAYDKALNAGASRHDLAAVVVPAFSFRFPRIADDSQTAKLQKLGFDELGVVTGAADSTVLAAGAALTEKIGGNGKLFAQQLQRWGSVTPVLPAQVTLENTTGETSQSPKLALPKLQYDLGAAPQFDVTGGEIVAQVQLQPFDGQTYTDSDPLVNGSTIRSKFETIQKMNLKFRQTSGGPINNTQILGRPLRQILVQPRKDADFLVESGKIEKALQELKAGNAVINWVSIATGPLSSAATTSVDLKEFEDAARRLRVSHAAGFFVDAKLPTTSMTYVLGDKNLKPGETRIRIFGF